jgi:iron complex transport system substrate-binding protein
VRIVSLLPSVTEIVVALGRGESLVGRTHECDFPASVQPVPVLTRSLIDHDPLDSVGIDRAVSSSVSTDGLYELDRQALEATRPDIVITQELCDVCAVDLDEVKHAVDALPGEVGLLSLEPETLEGVLASIVVVGQVIGASGAAESLVADLRARLTRVREAVVGRPVPRVALLEWLDPPYAAGHWVPHQITAAGGVDVLGRPGQRSVRVTPDAVSASSPDVLLLAPCGWTAQQAREAATPHVLAMLLGDAGEHVRIIALDANAHFSRPGPRLVDGVEILGALLHPDAGLPEPPRDAFVEYQPTR